MLICYYLYLRASFVQDNQIYCIHQMKKGMEYNVICFKQHYAFAYDFRLNYK